MSNGGVFNLGLFHCKAMVLLLFGTEKNLVSCYVWTSPYFCSLQVPSEALYASGMEDESWLNQIQKLLQRLDTENCSLHLKEVCKPIERATREGK